MPFFLARSTWYLSERQASQPDSIKGDVKKKRCSKVLKEWCFSDFQPLFPSSRLGAGAWLCFPVPEEVWVSI
jgi:hypothetical protein